jgi:starvation-inducible DNA-binding protein
MTDHNRQAISDVLARLLADTYAVYLKTQNFHWNITGPEFFSLHILFEKQYTELSVAIDEIAERIRALGFYVEGSFEAFKKMSSIKDSDKVLSARDMIQLLLDGHEVLIRHARHLSALAEKENDPATVDLMGRRLNVHEKFAWMLRSQL